MDQTTSHTEKLSVGSIFADRYKITRQLGTGAVVSAAKDQAVTAVLFWPMSVNLAVCDHKARQLPEVSIQRRRLQLVIGQNAADL